MSLGSFHRAMMCTTTEFLHLRADMSVTRRMPKCANLNIIAYVVSVVFGAKIYFVTSFQKGNVIIAFPHIFFLFSSSFLFKRVFQVGNVHFLTTP